MRRVLLLVLITTGCGVELPVPDTLEITCGSDADCTAGRVCAPLVGRCVTEIDALAPRIVGADTPAEDRVRVVFSEPVECSAVTDTASYAITPTLIVSAATGTGCSSGDGLTTEVTLFTGVQAPGQSYVLTAGGITDSGGNPLASDGAAAQFTGFGQAPDPSPPDALSPANHARALGSAQGLVWTRRSGASVYIVDVATDAAFTAPIAGSPFTVSAPATSLSLAGLTDVTYFWRIRSDLTPVSTVLTVYDFDVLIDTVYVACAPGDPCTEGGLRNGSRTRPYASVQRSLAAAAELSTSLDVPTVNVKIAARGAVEAYVGPVIVQWQSVRLLGGYDATFTTRDPSPNVTVIEGTGTVLAVGNLPAPMSGLVEGLTLRSSTASATATLFTVTAASSALVVRNVVVHSGDNAFGSSVAVMGGPSSGPVFENCVFETAGKPGGDAQILSVSGAAPTFRTTTLRVTNATGLDSASLASVTGPIPGDALFENCTMIAPDAVSSTRVMDVGFNAPSAGRVVIRKSLLATGAGSSATADTSVFLSSTEARILIEDSVVSAGPVSEIYGGSCHVFREGGGAEIVIRNSVLQTTQGPSSNCATIETLSMTGLELTNSVIIGNSTGDTPLIIRDMHPLVTSTLIVAQLGGNTCIDQSWGGTMNLGTPIAFQNNALANCTYAYSAANGNAGVPPPTVATTSAELNALNGMPIRDGVCADAACPQGRFTNNVVTADTLASIFVDADGPDNDLATITDNDYHLKPTANVAIRQGGLAAGATTCGPIGQSTACAIPVKDFDGDARAVPYSIGPDERD